MAPDPMGRIVIGFAQTDRLVVAIPVRAPDQNGRNDETEVARLLAPPQIMPRRKGSSEALRIGNMVGTELRPAFNVERRRRRSGDEQGVTRGADLGQHPESSHVLPAAIELRIHEKRGKGFPFEHHEPPAENLAKDLGLFEYLRNRAVLDDLPVRDVEQLDAKAGRIIRRFHPIDEVIDGAPRRLESTEPRLPQDRSDLGRQAAINVCDCRGQGLRGLRQSPKPVSKPRRRPRSRPYRGDHSAS